MFLILVIIVLIVCFLCISSKERPNIPTLGMWEDEDSFDEDERRFIATGMAEDETHRTLKVDQDTWAVIEKKTKDARAGSMDRFASLEKISYYSTSRDDTKTFKVSNKIHYKSLQDFIDGPLSEDPKAFFPACKKKADAIDKIGEFYKADRVDKMGGIVVFDIVPE